MTLEECRVGATVYYVLPRSPINKRPQTLYWAVEIAKVTTKRVVVHDVRNGRRLGFRILRASSVVAQPPAGASVV